MTDPSQADFAITSRRSIRRYLPTPIPRETIAAILDVAARAPSGTNMQPWRLIALTGAPLDTFLDQLAATYLAGTEAEKIEHIYYPSPLFEP